MTYNPMTNTLIEASRIHLDPLGGIAGDMFVAALLDALPALRDPLLAEVGKLPLPPEIGVAVVDHGDGVLTGSRFVVGALQPRGEALPERVHGVGSHAAAADGHTHDHTHDHRHDHEGAHSHVDHRAVRRLLQQAGLEPRVLGHALALFSLLAEAEGAVHGIPADDVTFHEVGAWDSIADFVAAAFLIDRLGAVRWTIGPLPLGGGRVRSAHGLLPVPAPATAVLMRGLPVVDDGIGGERVTPTGAAIARYLALQPYSDDTGTPAPSSAPLSEFLQLRHVGHGFGTRRLPGVANVLRCLVYQPLETTGRSERRRETIAWMHFEIDDQPAEDLAVALDRLRTLEGVLELYQLPLFGKKGRLATQIQILVEEPRVDAVAEACFRETTTLGLRVLPVQRRFLARRAATVPASGDRFRVKLAERPAGERTAKAEMDDLARIEGGYAARQRARGTAESRALHQPGIGTDADLERHGR